MSRKNKKFENRIKKIYWSTYLCHRFKNLKELKEHKFIKVYQNGGNPNKGYGKRSDERRQRLAERRVNFREMREEVANVYC